MSTPYAAHRRALAEAQAWVMGRLRLGNPAQVLRSEELGACLSGYPEYWFWTETNIAEIAELIRQRHELVSLPNLERKYSGRILCCFYGRDTHMGEGEPASEGIIDYAYLPPWDTWFAVLDDLTETHILLAWIPEQLTELVENAISASATESISWLDEVVSGMWPIMGTPFESTRVNLTQVYAEISQ